MLGTGNVFQILSCIALEFPNICMENIIRNVWNKKKFGKPLNEYDTFHTRILVAFAVQNELMTIRTFYNM